MSSEFRRKKIRTNLYFAIFELIIVALSSVLIINYSSIGFKFTYFETEDEQELRDKIVPWTQVYGGFYIIVFLRRLILIFLWCCMNDPRRIQASSNFLTFIFLNTFEVAWFIYGNYIFFSHNGLYGSDANVTKLRIIMLIILIWGYINMFIYILSFLAIILLILALYGGGFLGSKYVQEGYDEYIEE